MRVLVAGASGALGSVLVPELIRSGHDVIGLTRSAEGAARVRSAGGSPVIADVLNRNALLNAAAGERADAVIHELTDLKKAPARHADMAPTDRLREVGSAHLLELAHAVGARRFVTQSIVFGYGYRDHGAHVLTEESPFGVPQGDAFDPHVAAMLSAEQQAMSAAGIEGVALRYGLFYGADIENVTRMLRRRALPVARRGGELPFVHHADAATATVAALVRAAPRSTYNIVDDRPTTFRQLVSRIAQTTGAPRPLVLPQWLLGAVAPYGAAVLGTVSMRVSNLAAKRDLDWTPRYPDYLAGLS